MSSGACPVQRAERLSGRTRLSRRVGLARRQVGELLAVTPATVSAVAARGRTERRDLVLALGQAAETTLGADLIYISETHGSFVLVQYKTMRDRLDGRPVFRPTADRNVEKGDSLGYVPSTSRRSMLRPRGGAGFVDVHTHADNREPICASLRL